MTEWVQLPTIFPVSMVIGMFALAYIACVACTVSLLRNWSDSAICFGESLIAAAISYFISRSFIVLMMMFAVSFLLTIWIDLLAQKTLKYKES